jgi:hypothetical protein
MYFSAMKIQRVVVTIEVIETTVITITQEGVLKDEKETRYAFVGVQSVMGHGLRHHGVWRHNRRTGDDEQPPGQ